MPTTNLSYTLPPLNRDQIRNHLIQQFLLEAPGTGKADLRSVYVYEVEQFATGGNILLKRPAALNKGMDFTIHVQGHRFRNRGMVDMPSHDNICDDLIRKQQSAPALYQRLVTLINQIYDCHHITPSDCSNLNFPQQSPSDLTAAQVLMCIKWLFIEQDITYWNWSGRAMFYGHLRQSNLC